MTNPKIFTTNHNAQIKWLDGQIAKNNGSIFLNSVKAEAAWRKLKRDLIIDEQALEKFVSRYLSEAGIKKLHITLRVAEARAKKKTFRLQCQIEYSANRKLESMISKTGLSKGELISQLIALSEVEEKVKIEKKIEYVLHCNKALNGKNKEVQEELSLD